MSVSNKVESFGSVIDDLLTWIEHIASVIRVIITVVALWNISKIRSCLILIGSSTHWSFLTSTTVTLLWQECRHLWNNHVAACIKPLAATTTSWFRFASLHVTLELVIIPRVTVRSLGSVQNSSAVWTLAAVNSSIWWSEFLSMFLKNLSSQE